MAIALRPGPESRLAAFARVAVLMGALEAACVILSAASGAAAPMSPAGALVPAALVPGAFEASIGLTRSQVEARFHEIDSGHTVFKAAAAVKGVPRVLGQDPRLYTIVEVNGFPAVVDVQLVSLLDTKSKTTLENQVVYDSLACGLLAEQAAQTWCTGRILNTNAHGLVTATKSATFGAVRIMVKTYQADKASSAPVVSVDVDSVVAKVFLAIEGRSDLSLLKEFIRPLDKVGQWQGQRRERCFADTVGSISAEPYSWRPP